MLENYYNELRDFLAGMECLKEFHKAKLGGPVQDVPLSSGAYDVGCRILLPLPFGKADLGNRIMDEIEEWASVRKLERFGFIAPGDCPLLCIGLREISATTT